MGLQVEDLLAFMMPCGGGKISGNGLHVVFRGWEHKDISLHISQYSEVALASPGLCTLPMQ